jgi:GT2 family glycosyltransferase
MGDFYFNRTHSLAMSQQSTRAAIVVVHYGDLNDTWLCLDSLGRLEFDSFQIVVVDNGTVPAATPEIARRYPRVDVIRSEVNSGWAGGNNIGIRHALGHGAEYVILLNNDTTVAPELLSSLIIAVQWAPDFGVLGPVINFMDEPGEVRTDGCMFNRPQHNGFFQRKEVPINKASPAFITEVDIVNGCCMMVDARVFQLIGLIDERFFLVHEESDLCLRARQAGLRCGVLGQALVWHKGSRSFAATGKRLQRYYDARNLWLLVRKHSRIHRQGRGPWRSRLEYFRSVYYRYCIEREEGQDETAESVLEGIWDAWADLFGAYHARYRPGLGVLRYGFDKWRHRRLLMNQEGAGRAPALH